MLTYRRPLSSVVQRLPRWFSFGQTHTAACRDCFRMEAVLRSSQLEFTDMLMKINLVSMTETYKHTKVQISPTANLLFKSC